MGAKGDGNSDSARARTIAFRNDDRKPSPIPLEECPWCGTKFKAASFRLLPNPDTPTDLRVTCVNRHCAFRTSCRSWPWTADLSAPALLPVATVDKFARCWTGDVGQFFGRRPIRSAWLLRACHPLQASACLLTVCSLTDYQDELHLISGPLGTYETAPDALCSRGQWPNDPTKNCGIDGDRPPGRAPDSGLVQPSARGYLSATRARSAGCVFCRNPPARAQPCPAVSRYCGPGTQSEGRHVTCLPGVARRGTASLSHPR